MKCSLQLNLLGSGLVRIEKHGVLVDSNCLSVDEDMSDVLVKPVILLPNVIELNYYANALTPLFAIDSIVCKYKI